MWRISEVIATFLDMWRCADVRGHIVALWRVLTGKVRADDCLWQDDRAFEADGKMPYNGVG